MININGLYAIEWWVTNCKMVTDWFVDHMDFKKTYYTGIETGDKNMTSYVIQKNNIRFIITSPIVNGKFYSRMMDHITKHGDSVKNLIYSVDNIENVKNFMIKNDMSIIGYHNNTRNDMNLVTVQILDNVWQSFIEIKNDFPFPLSLYEPIQNIKVSSVTDLQDIEHTSTLLCGDLPKMDNLDINLLYVDHIAYNTMKYSLEQSKKKCIEILQLQEYITNDDNMNYNEYNTFNTVVLANWNHTVKLSINEPSKDDTKSKIDNFLTYNNGSGIEHIALYTSNIVITVANLKEKGINFLTVPAEYYKIIREKVHKYNIKLHENLEMLRAFNIMIDINIETGGYILQAITESITERPTLCFEIIQRHNSDGFGMGNYKSLHESLSRRT